MPVHTNSRGKTLRRVRGPNKDCHSILGAATPGATHTGNDGNCRVSIIQRDLTYQGSDRLDLNEQRYRAQILPPFGADNGWSGTDLEPLLKKQTQSGSDHCCK